MPVGLDQSYLLTLFSGGSSSSSGFDYSSLAVGATAAAANGAAAPAKPVAPTAPWTTPETPTQASASVQKALAGHAFIDESAAKLDLPGASADYKKLFAVYQGLSTLQDIVTQAGAKGVTALDKTELSAAFNRGVSEVASYVGSASFDQLRLAEGTVQATASSKLQVPKATNSYVTPNLTSSATDPVAAFQGDVQFDISIKRIGITHDVPINLDDMGSQPRTIGNVVNFINQQLKNAGVETSFSTVRTPGGPKTITVGGKTITLSTNNPDQWALKLNAGAGETVTLGAPATAGAVYVAQSIGDPDPDKDPTTADSTVQQQLTKFQTDTTNVDAPPQIPGQANFTDGRTFAQTLGPEVKTVHATQVGPDGSVYMLADVTAATGGQAINGTQDVALLKYDSAGKLVYTRTLGAEDSATGLGLAVSADGKVAVTGAVTGTLVGATNGALNSGPTGAFKDDTDSFVTLYDASGNEMWTARRGASLNDEANQVAFGADGTVYVAGRTQSALPGSAPTTGGYDGYIQAFTTSATGTPTSTFTQTYGTSGSDKPAGLVVDGNSLITASVEDGHAVLRRFDISSGTPVLSSSRDLGDLQGGTIAGLALDGSQVVVAGTTSNAALSAGAVTRAASGGTDAFAATLAADLSSQPGDAIAYYGGSGDDRATALGVANGQVWIAGTAGTDLPGEDPVGTKDGFLANLNVATGSIDWSQRFTGKNGMAAPTAIAVAPTGASVLDRLGLPSGTLNLADSQLLVAQSSLRAGDQFTVKASDGPAKTITIDPGETLATLAQKITRASGFEATAKVATTLNGKQQINITPANPRMTVTIGAGKTNANALADLGIPEGVVAATQVVNGLIVPSDGKAQLYGLGLSTTLNINDAAQMSHAAAQVSAAISVIRRAYQGLVTAATPQTPQTAAAKNASANGPVPAYLQAQIANYQAGLARLTGGG